MERDKVIGDKQNKLKMIQKNIEDATEKKELQQIEEELKVLEREIQALDNPVLKDSCLAKMKALKSREEIYALKKEIRFLKKDVSKREKEFQEKSQKVDTKDLEKERFLNALDDLENSRDVFLKKIEEAIKGSLELKKKVERDIEVTETVEIVKKRQSVLLETLMLVYVAKSGMDKVVKGALTLALVSDICDKLQVKDEEIVHYEYHYENLEKIIDQSLESVEDIEKDMMDALEEVSDLEKDYEKKFGDFKHLKEFQDILGMLDTIEKTLDKELGNVKDIEKDLGKSLDENNAKVLKLDSM